MLNFSSWRAQNKIWKQSLTAIAICSNVIWKYSINSDVKCSLRSWVTWLTPTVFLDMSIEHFDKCIGVILSPTNNGLAKVLLPASCNAGILLFASFRLVSSKTSASFLSKSELQESSEVFVCFDFSSGTRVGGLVDQTMKTPLVEQQRRAKHVET